MDYYAIYISIVFLLKILFVILASANVYLKFKNKTGSDLDKEILFWKERVEFVFIVLMAILLIYLFNPIKNKLFMINNETKLLLYLFGIVLIITANWETFFKTSDVFKKIQTVV